MGSKKELLLQLAVCFLSLVVTLDLQASGITLYEISPSNVALASAGWSARAKDPATVFTNPAGMSCFCRSNVGASLEPIYVHVKFQPNEGTDVPGDAGNASLWIPAGGFYTIYPLSQKWRIGIASFGYFGSRLEYNSDWVGRYYVTKAVMQGFSASIALSYQLTERLSIGIGYTPMYAIYEQRSRINNALDSLPDGRLRLKDNAFGNGFSLGLLYQINPCTRFGIQYLSTNRLNFKDIPSFSAVGPTLSQVIAELNLDDTPIEIDIRVPQSVMMGFYHAFNPCFAVMADVGWQQWSRFGFVEITFSDPNISSLSAATKYSNGWHLGVGVELHPKPCLTVLTGIAFDSTMVSFSQRTFNFPIGKQWRFGTGLSWCFAPSCSLDAAYEFNWTGDLPCARDRGALAGQVSGTFTKTSAHFFNLGLKKCF